MATAVSIDGIPGTIDRDVLASFLQVNADQFNPGAANSALGALGLPQFEEGGQDLEGGLLPLDDEAGRIQDAAAPRIFIPNGPFLLFNLLSTRWTWERFEQNPSIYPILYIFGSIAYAIALPLRVLIFAIAFIRWVISPLILLFSCQTASFGREMKERSLVMLGSLGELTSGVVGVACPPVAYVFDEWIQKNETIHEWYRSNNLSLWNHELESALTGNHERMARKKDALRADGDDIVFKRAKDDLGSQYLSSENEVEAMSSISVALIPHFGFLDLLRHFWDQNPDEPAIQDLEILEGNPIKKYISGVVDRVVGDRQAELLKSSGRQELDENEKRILARLAESKQTELFTPLNQFGRIWQLMVSQHPEARQPDVQEAGLMDYFSKSVKVVTRTGGDEPGSIEPSISQKTLEGIRAALVLKEVGSNEASYNDAETKARLEATLSQLESITVVAGANPLNGRAAVEMMADAIQFFSQNVKTADREMEIQICQLAYK